MPDYQTENSNSDYDALEPSQTTDDTLKTASAKSARFSLLFVGLAFAVALLLGAAIGYGFGRSQSQPPDVVVITATPADAVAQVEDNPAQSAEEPDSAASQPTPTIMDLVLSDARHFQGNADAPVTVVEFSDFK